MTLAVLGATGFTGRLVVEEARRAGLPLRLVGRRRAALDEVARDGEEVRVADAMDESALREAFDGASVVVSLAGPFLELGFGPVTAAVEAGAHYLDTTGEQEFARRVHERFAGAPVAVLPSFGFDYVPGDLAARLAAQQVEGQVEGPLDEIAIAYSVKGVGTSKGTRRTIATVMGQEQVTYLDGRLVPSRFGERTRKMHFPFGEKTVVEWGGTEPLTVPRHTDVRNVHSFIRAPAVASVGGRLGPLVSPVFKRLTRFGPSGPSAESRRKSSFTVVAEARGPGGTGRAVLAGSDVYGLTALLIVRGAQAMIAGEARGTGVLAPAEAFDVDTLVESLAPLLRVE
ncbi:MAG: NAD(P)H-binding protein [Actinobacteria bacterium]|nr:NAD(P)H-binding protein [Actinomycetota bacterium]